MASLVSQSSFRLARIIFFLSFRGRKMHVHFLVCCGRYYAYFISTPWTSQASTLIVALRINQWVLQHDQDSLLIYLLFTFMEDECSTHVHFRRRALAVILWSLFFSAPQYTITHALCVKCKSSLTRTMSSKWATYLLTRSDTLMGHQLKIWNGLKLIMALVWCFSLHLAVDFTRLAI